MSYRRKIVSQCIFIRITSVNVKSYLLSREKTSLKVTFGHPSLSETGGEYYILNFGRTLSLGNVSEIFFSWTGDFLKTLVSGVPRVEKDQRYTVEISVGTYRQNQLNSVNLQILGRIIVFEKPPWD